MNFATELSPLVKLLREFDARTTSYLVSQLKQVFKTASTSPSSRLPVEKQLIETSSFHLLVARHEDITRLIAAPGNGPLMRRYKP